MSNERTLTKKVRVLFVCLITLSEFCMLVKEIVILYSELRQEVRQMKQKDYHIYLDEQEYSQVIQSLITLKNKLNQRKWGSFFESKKLCEN